MIRLIGAMHLNAGINCRRFLFPQTLLNRIHKPEIKKTAYLYQKFNKLGITFPYISSLFKILLEKSRIGVNLCSIL